MKKNIDFSKYYDEALFAGIAIAVILVVWYLYKYLRKKSGEDRNVEIDDNNLTITETQAQLISENLLSAMNRFGTDEQAIYDEFDKIESPDDMVLVSEKFGIKKYDGAGEAIFFGMPKNLKGWLYAELNDKAREPIENKIKWL